jgi:acetoin:2,6-dichlorophenolindophenol oxidoreductase subunit alpha
VSVQIERREQLVTAVGRLRRMLEIRAVEEAIQVLFNEGHVRGSTHLSIGQEAVSVGIASATRPTDLFSCTYRGHGAALALGVTPVEVLGEICGRTIGCAGGVGGSMHLVGADVGLFPTSAIVGGGIPIAVGAALAAQHQGTDTIAVSVCGDGATNIGAFHESLNLAAIWALPVVFVIENNLYGEYTRIELSTPVLDLAARAASYAMPAHIVDGQDVDAVAAAMAGAAEHARAGGGPTLLEVKTYRYSGHSKSDPGTYRPPGELDEWRRRDPIEILSARLVESGAATAGEIDDLRTAVAADVKQAVADALASEAPGEQAIFEHVFG